MADERDHDASGGEAGDEVREALETAFDVAERVGEGAGQAQEVVRGGGTGAPDAMGALRGTGAALGAAEQIAGAAGADAAVRQVLGVASQAASLAATAYEAGEAIVELGEAIVSAITGGTTAHRVSYELACDAERDAQWRVLEVEIEEALNRPYRARVLLVTENLDAIAANLLGQDCCLTVRRGDETSRALHGLVSRVDHGRRTERDVTARIEIVPALDVLRHVHESRIFQDLTALEIIDAFLGEHLAHYGRELRIDATGTYLRRELCVQYQESALAFFDRLCEEEGLTYAFDQSGERETLVVVDDNAGFAPARLLPTATDVPYVAQRGGDIAGAEPVHELTAADQLGPTSLTLADFDWTSDVLPFSSEERSRDVRDREREQYEHGLTIVGHYDEQNRRYTERDVRARVLRGRERQALTTFEYRGTGAVIGFVPGTLFTLAGHPEPGLDGEYLLVSVRHRGREMHGGDTPEPAEREGELEYANEFVCIPSSVPHRPQRGAPKPRIAGVQTALVVGPSSEEIWTDEHGRIRLQLHWDRQGHADERSACWVRVMQSWAGPGFGTMFIPRVGMEVVVTFVDGDPDRPLVTGCVYNATNVPALTLPDDKTQSILRTKSSPGSDGFNELRFEDNVGSERVYVHAERDLTEDVLHDHTTHVRRNQSNTVDADHTETVGQDQTLVVRRHRKATVDGNETEVVDGSRVTTIRGGQGNEGTTGAKVSITGSYAIDVSEETLVDTRRKATIRVGESVVEITPERVTLRAAGGAQLVLDTEVRLESHDGTQIHLARALHASGSEGASLDLTKDATLAGNEGGFVELSKNASMSSQSGRAVVELTTGAVLSSTGNVEIEAAMDATVTANKEASLANAVGRVMVAASGVSVSGPTVEIAGQATTTISGSLVDIN